MVFNIIIFCLLFCLSGVYVFYSNRVFIDSTESIIKASEFLFYKRDSSVEHAFLLVLNEHNRLVRCYHTCLNERNRVGFGIEGVISYSKRNNVSGVILIHNHPSLDIEPSKLDLNSTKKAAKELNYQGIKLKDHVILGGKEHYSFAENGLL